MASTWNKKEREQKKKQSQKQKEERRQQRKEDSSKGKSLDAMMAYVDENGDLTSKPPDPTKKIIVNVEDIAIGVAQQRDLEPEELVRTGVVTFFNNAKGFGFIKDKKTQESFFVHINSSAIELQENIHVKFEVEKGPKGLVAVRVQKAD